MESNYHSGEQWFALRVKGRSEQVTSTILENKGYQAFLPTYRPRLMRPDSMGRLDRPLFPGYIFCRFDLLRRLPILTTPGVIHVVGAGKIPVPVDDQEIRSLQRVVKQQLDVSPSDFLTVGDRVRIIEGALAGVEGILMEFRNGMHLVLSVSLLCRSIRVELHKDFVVSSTPGLQASTNPRRIA